MLCNKLSVDTIRFALANSLNEKAFSREIQYEFVVVDTKPTMSDGLLRC